MSSTAMHSLAILIIISQPILAERVPDWDNGQDFMGAFLNLRFKPISIDVDTHKLQKVFPPTPLTITATEYDETVTVNTGQSVQTTNEIHNWANATGGLLQGTFIRLGWTYYWCSVQWNGKSGTSIDGKSFPLEVRVLWRNSKYRTLVEAVEHQDGLMELVFVYNICSTTSEPFKKVTEALKQIHPAGTFKVIPASVHIDASNFISLDGSYYSYLGSFLDTYTGVKHKCSRVILTKPNPTYCITKTQFQETFSSLKDFWGEPYSNTLPHDFSATPVSLVEGGIIQNLLTCDST